MLVKGGESKEIDAGNDAVVTNNTLEMTQEAENNQEMPWELEESLDMGIDQDERNQNSAENWLEREFESVPVATSEEVKEAFNGLSSMMQFWMAEHHSNGGGGGVRHLVSRAFNQTELDETRIPTIEESKLHVLNFIQYQSMSEKQKERNACITGQLYRAGTALGETGMPSYRQQKKKNLWKEGWTALYVEHSANTGCSKHKWNRLCQSRACYSVCFCFWCQCG